MTAQIPEALWYEGMEHALCSEPLEDYFQQIDKLPPFEEMHTACWRRYVGEWEVRDDRLYLIGIEAHLENGDEASLASIFPEFPERVFAHWFTGTIRLPQGDMLEYVHMGYHSTYERDLLLTFENGILVGKTLRENVANDA